jgi:hypothetical protein
MPFFAKYYKNFDPGNTRSPFRTNQFLSVGKTAESSGM